MPTVRGLFDVKMTPEASEEADGNTVGRFALDKRYHGPLAAEGKGAMLSALTATRGSAAYVAMERVTGTLEGKAGSFVIHHRGLMQRGAQSLEIAVVPDSGTGALAGMTGAMRITIAEGAHHYELEYALPEG